MHKTLAERGMRLPNLSEYAVSLLPSTNPHDDLHINQFGSVGDVDVNAVSAVETRPGHYRLFPGPEFGPRLYRGQNKRYATCQPSLYRKKKLIDHLASIAKIMELRSILQFHPACADIFGIEIEGLHFDFNFESIAQHYGFSTSMLDFSRSIDVAMFFATCGYDERNDTYHPLTAGEGVLYTADLASMIGAVGSEGFIPMGLEPLPRPEAQRAFAIRLSPEDNLDAMPWVALGSVAITPELSGRYFEMFEGGAKLFPSNPFDQRIIQTRRSRVIPLEAIELGAKLGWLASSTEGATQVLDAAGYRVSSEPIRVSPEIIEAAKAEWEARRPSFFSRIRLRGRADLLIVE